ncbi:MAG: hypothetical protein PHU77_14695 [Simplicispira sp.]|nr:hypothetical protein [Simplicispira sp.]
MIRCLAPLRAPALLGALLFFGVFATAPAAAQTSAAGPINVRNFPEQALRGTLVVTGLYDAELNGKTIRMAPGVRLLSPQNALLPIHTTIGKPFTVNYVNETSTGMLLTAWILSPSEAAQKRRSQ